ncbi:MAG: TetR/AcrR family transcriptional regulator [Nitrospiria bacterium]
MANSSTASTIMDVAEELIQRQGCNAFSYRDLSERIGIKTSSIHYHFNTKSDLVNAVMIRYHDVFSAKLETLKKEDSAKKQFITYISLFAGTYRKGRRICLCASLASDLDALPDDTCDVITRFVTAQEEWLSSVLRKGIENGDFRRLDDINQTARNIFYTLQGAMLMARTSSVERIEDAGKWIQSFLES